MSAAIRPPTPNKEDVATLKVLADSRSLPDSLSLPGPVDRIRIPTKKQSSVQPQDGTPRSTTKVKVLCVDGDRVLLSRGSVCWWHATARERDNETDKEATSTYTTSRLNLDDDARILYTDRELGELVECEGGRLCWRNGRPPAKPKTKTKTKKKPPSPRQLPRLAGSGDADNGRLAAIDARVFAAEAVAREAEEATRARLKAASIGSNAAPIIKEYARIAQASPSTHNARMFSIAVAAFPSVNLHFPDISPA